MVIEAGWAIMRVLIDCYKTVKFYPGDCNKYTLKVQHYTVTNYLNLKISIYFYFIIRGPIVYDNVNKKPGMPSMFIR